MTRLAIVRSLLAGVVGSLVFWLFQVLSSGFTIPQYMGEQIAVQGGYPRTLAPLIGWGVHLGVSLSYALLFAVLAAVLSAKSPGRTLGLSLVLAALLGWITTLVTAPAIAVTINVLSRKGFPAELPGLNTDLGLPLYNHLLFFAVVWMVTVLVPTLKQRP
jgi:hypothetical protein